MSTYLYELPTTGAISFGDFCIDRTNSYTIQIAECTQARANLRAALKESKRTDGEKDYLKLVKVLDDYLPHLCGIMASFDADEITLSSEPVFSWRTTLSANLFNNSPRQSISSLNADLAFTLLTYAFALSNLARSTVAALGNYEHQRAISEVERKAKDEKLNFSVTLLCKASGIFAHISEHLLPEWDKNGGSVINKPPDLTPEVTSALSKMALADAQTLAIRKLLSKSAYDSVVAPGPPLPQSHPSPALIAKLYLECATLYASARSLAKTPGKAKTKDTDEVSPELRRYLADEEQFCGALARKWLGVDAGENGGEAKGGESVGFLAWAKAELDELKDGGRGVNIGKGKEKKERRKEKVVEELESVNVFLKNFRKMNDTLHFQPVPSMADLQSTIPAGRMAVAIRLYTLPLPAFGPGSVEYTRRQVDEMASLGDETKDADSSPTVSYAGAGQYF
ncbi:hypothetical protein BD410DRAFT_716479 [Rickenella mellea]|uniref:pH-response regulator protein palC n=1 Tax=Rickenella mellea TaxID=50990 RepID=A0A4Y7QFP1_9AGAM|nr:hypothetical protein BD410DRAFT_716479 [Rickenella mellea]